MSKTAAKQRVSAKRGFANGRGNLFRLRLAATHGTCGFVNRRPFANHNNIYALLSFKIEYT